MKDILSGWNDIAKYIKRSVTTAQRYEQNLGLPVHRLGNGPKPPVHALQSELDRWLRGTAVEHIGRDMRENLDQHPNLVTSRDGAFLRGIMDRVHSLINTTLYRFNYHMVFDLQRIRSGTRANITVTFELINPTNENRPYVQEITIDDCEDGHVEEMAILKNGVMIYSLKNPPLTEKQRGYSVYHGKELTIEPESSGVSYACRVSWTIKRATEDFWYNHMVLPTLGVDIETHAPLDFEITPSFSTPALILKSEHLDIVWGQKK